MRAFLQSIHRQRRLQVCVKVIAAALALAAAPTAFSQIIGEGSYDAHGVLWTPWNPDDWTRRFRLGASVSFNISAKFNMSGKFGVSGNNPDAGTYDDGYVHPDNSGDPTYTSNWGYKDASQYDPVNNTITFSAASGYTAADRANENAGAVPGIDLAYSAYLWHWRHLGIGWELGFDWLPINIIDNNTLNDSSVDVNSYVYHTGGIVIPDPPYQGGASGTGPLLPGTHPDPLTSSSSATITGSRTLDINLYIFRLGPTFNLDLGKSFSVTASVGPALGIVDGTYLFDEHITPDAPGATPSRNKGQFGSTELVYGGYVNATLIYHLPQSDGRADLYLSTQYMPLSSATYKGDGREGKLELGGQMSISVGVNWPF